MSANIPIEEPETSYLCWLSSLAVALSDRADTQQAIDVRGKSAQELLAHKMFQGQRSQIPPLVLALGFQLVGWCLAPQTLPEVFGSDKSVFELIMADIDFVLNGLSELRGLHPARPLGHSILHVSSVMLYGMGLLGSCSNETSKYRGNTSALSSNAGNTLRSITNTFRGLECVGQLLDGLVAGRLEEKV